MKTTSVIVDNIYPIIEKALPTHINAYRKNIQQFFQKRSSSIYAIAPYDRIYFGIDDINDLFDSIKVDKKEITQELQKTYYWSIANFNPRAAKDEFTITMMMIIRYFVMEYDMKNAELSSIYLAFSGKFYPSIHYQKWKIPPSKNKHVMDYVINNMLTQKYDLKREGSVFGAIRSLCRTWLDTYKDKMKTADDEDIKDMIQQLHGRIKSMLGNIASLFYKAYEDGSYIAYDSDNESDENYRIADNDSLRIERYVENTMNYINTNTVNYQICRLSSDSNVKVDEVKFIIESIQADRENIPVIKELIRIIISEYFASSTEKDILSSDFIVWAISSKPNSKNKNIIRQKEIIESWLDENSPQYRKRKSRLQTKSSYYKSVLQYYVLIINKANK